ncbi:recombination-associated protein RdgC [Testudinibacter sp. P80/BLE/0925]
MWFKNIMPYSISKSLDWSDLQNQLLDNAYAPCGSYEYSKFGWASPLHDSELLHHSASGFILLVARKEEKIIPPHVIKKHLDERIKKLEERENRKLSKGEKLALKDDVLNELLPRAFSKVADTALLIDTDKDRIYVDATSDKRAEEALGLLRKSLGSLPVVPFVFANTLSEVMTDWVANNNAPEWLTVLEEAELTSIKDESVIRCKHQDLDSEEVLHCIATADKQITKLALEREDRLSFILHDDSTIKRIKFADFIRKKNDDIVKEDFAQRFDADFVLMTAEISELFDLLASEFEANEVEDEFI